MMRGSKLEPRPIDWLIPRRIPAGMITLVGGRPGQGKSMFTNWLTAEVTRQGHAVIHSNQEDAVREVLVPRLRVAGADMRRVHLPEEPILLPDHIGSLERKIKQIGARLLVVDAAAQHLTVSIFSDQEVRRALTPLRQVLERTGCACVMVTHTVKHVPRHAHPLEAIGGAGGGLVGAARLVYIFGPDPKDPDARILAPAKSNIGPMDAGTEFEVEIVEWSINRQRGGRLTNQIAKLNLVSNHSKVTAAAVVSFNGGRKAGDDATDATRVAMAEEWLTGLLMHAPMKCADVEAEGKKVKLSWATIRRASTSIEVEKKRIGFGKNGHWQWDLPDGHPLRKARVAKAAAATAAAGGGDGDEFSKIVAGIDLDEEEGDEE
jgi:putative DNA primase/helicase